jgi:glycosyltransferase involved in cell wall biosynthesis
VPIVAYATGGIPYINEFDKNILLVPTGDYISLAKKALWLLNNEEQRVALAEKAYHYGLKEYSLKSNYERLINAYKQIISESKNDEP